MATVRSLVTGVELEVVDSAVLIEELHGEKRALELRGAGLPKRGVPWGGTQRLKTTWYPGNAAEATQHVLGPTELDSPWEGEWNTTRLVVAPSVYYPKGTAGSDQTKLVRPPTLRDLLEDFFRQASRLRVTWTSKERKLVREGRAGTWKFDHDRIDDIRWSVTFVWTGRGGTQQKVISLRDDAMDAAVRHGLTLLAETEAILTAAKLVSKKRTIPKSADKFTLGQLEALADGPSKLLRDFQRTALRLSSRLKQLGDIANKVRGMPFQLANQALDAAQTFVTAFNQFSDEVSRKPPELLTTKRKVADLTRTARLYGDHYQGATKGSRAATTLRQNMAARARAIGSVQYAGTGVTGVQPGGIITPPLAVHVVREGETAVTIALKYYGTAAYAVALLKANKLPVYQVRIQAGTVLIIPSVTGLQASMGS